MKRAKKVFRGTLFLVLMLISSITFTGCDASKIMEVIGKILPVIQAVIGAVAGIAGNASGTATIATGTATVASTTNPITQILGTIIKARPETGNTFNTDKE
jgi:hypothetical protein